MPGTARPELVAKRASASAYSRWAPIYDLIFDPNERNNLAAEPGSENILAGMRIRLDNWMHRTGDPLLNGPVPAPHGSQINNPDGISPKETPDRVA